MACPEIVNVNSAEVQWKRISQNLEAFCVVLCEHVKTEVCLLLTHRQFLALVSFPSFLDGSPQSSRVFGIWMVATVIIYQFLMRIRSQSPPSVGSPTFAQGIKLLISCRFATFPCASVNVFIVFAAVFGSVQLLHDTFFAC